MDKCPSCNHDISSKAKTCPSCGHPIKQKTSGCTWIFILSAVFFLAVAFSGQGNTGTSAYNPDDYDITTAWQFVERGLRSPSTAVFPQISEHKVYSLPDYENGYEVHGYVDAQNGFGAMIRSNFICELYYDSESDNWRLIDLQLK